MEWNGNDRVKTAREKEGEKVLLSKKTSTPLFFAASPLHTPPFFFSPRFFSSLVFLYRAMEWKNKQKKRMSFYKNYK